MLAHSSQANELIQSVLHSRDASVGSSGVLSGPAIEVDKVPGDEPYLDRLFGAGLLLDTGVDGLYGRGAKFEDVVERLGDVLGSWGEGKDVEVVRFPPAMSRQVLEESGHWRNFPEQIGNVFSFCGSECNHQSLLQKLGHEDEWSSEVSPTDVTMTPVACLPVYPIMAARGPLPAAGRLLDISSYCYRHEPSKDPERMTLFRQREYVCMGTPEQVMAFRAELMRDAQLLMAALGLPFTLEKANDPFFGREGKLMIDSQRQQALKFEILIPAINPAKPTACGSFNYHRDRFSSVWGIYTHTGETAHTGCCGFGLERIALSLFKVHGFDTTTWPAQVRTTLWGE